MSGPTRAILLDRLARAEAKIARLTARDRMTTPTQAEKEIREHADIGALEQEHFWVICLDARQKILRLTTAHMGTLTDYHDRLHVYQRKARS